MRWFALFWLAVVGGCTRSTPSDVVVAVPSAPPAVSTAVVAPSVSASAAPKTYVSNLVMVGGDLVDLDTMTVKRTLSKDMLWVSTVTDDTAYLFVNGDLRAFDVATGAMRWSKSTPSCWRIEASRAGVFCSTESGARFYKKSNGDDTAVGSGATVSGMVRIGARVLVLHSDSNVEALDENGAVVGSVLVPFSLTNGWTRNALVVAGSFACGAQGSDRSTNVVCVDSAPRVVWFTSLNVRRGVIEQADDVVLVSSGPFGSSKPASSEVLRTSDGTSLLRANVRFAAVLSTAGTFDGALAVDPSITLYDAKGAVKWTWAGPPFHDESLHALRSGSNIVLAQHSPIATGVRLVALDEAKGALVWQGNVDSLLIAHSKYSNQVELRKSGNAVLLLGHESSQEYAQTFDPASGTRLVSILRGR
jgi:hypothetical protein